MPRGPRLDTTNAFHHVMARAIERGVLFHSDADRQRLVDRLAAVVGQGGAAVYAWSLMPNHFHLLLRTGRTPLSQLMQRLLTGYAVSFNHRYRRRGHLFQNRFQSILVDADSYLLELVRYIHLNPLRAGVVASVEELETYRWTGHAALLGEHPPAWQAADELLAHFAARLRTARMLYRRFVNDGIGAVVTDEKPSDGFVRVADGLRLVRRLRRGREAWAFAERVRGDARFVDRLCALRPAVADRPRREEGIDVVARLAGEYGVLPSELAGGGRRPIVTQARRAAARVLVRDHGMSFAGAARLLGVSKWAVARALQRPAGD